MSSVAPDAHGVIVIELGREYAVALEPAPETAVIMAGDQGPPGPPGIGSTQPPIQFGYGDVSPRAVLVLSAPALLMGLQLLIEQPFNGEAPALLVRTGDGLVLMAAEQNAPGLAATYETTPAAQLAVGTQIIIETTPGAGATAGSGKLLLNLH